MVGGAEGEVDGGREREREREREGERGRERDDDDDDDEHFISCWMNHSHTCII